MSYFSTSTIHAGIPIPGMLTVGPALSEATGGLQRGVVPVTFFGVALPLFVQSLLYQIPLTVSLVIAATRRMESAQAMLFSKSTAVAFLAIIATLSLGGVMGHPALQADWLVPILAYVQFGVACLLILAVTPSQGLYRSGARRSKRIGMARPPLWADDSSNRAAVFVMAGLMMATVAGHSGTRSRLETRRPTLEGRRDGRRSRLVFRIRHSILFAEIPQTRKTGSDDVCVFLLVVAARRGGPGSDGGERTRCRIHDRESVAVFSGLHRAPGQPSSSLAHWLRPSSV